MDRYSKSSTDKEISRKLYSLLCIINIVNQSTTNQFYVH